MADNIFEKDLLYFEQRLWANGIRCIAGVDEAGRGPLAGPVVAAAVVFRPHQALLPGINDSKKLSAKQREKAFSSIYENAWAVAIGMATESEIDQLNIRCATFLAMERAVAALSVKVEHCLVDGHELPLSIMHGEAIIKGDQRSMSIAAASIVAKVTRDRLMIEYDGQYPQYGFAQHKGYPTAAHLQALRLHGLCPIHRRSFHPKLLNDQLEARL